MPCFIEELWKSYAFCVQRSRMLVTISWPFAFLPLKKEIFKCNNRKHKITTQLKESTNDLHLKKNNLKKCFLSVKMFAVDWYYLCQLNAFCTPVQLSVLQITSAN